MLVRDVNAVECQDEAASEGEPKTPVLRAHQHSSARAYRNGSYCERAIVLVKKSYFSETVFTPCELFHTDLM